MRWRGFNLLGMFRAPTIGLAPDPRVDGHFVEWEFKALHDWGFNFARLPLVERGDDVRDTRLADFLQGDRVRVTVPSPTLLHRSVLSCFVRG